MRIMPLVAAAVLLGGGVVVACSEDDDPTGPVLENDFTATLTGAAERPNPVTTTATGNATVTIGVSSLTVTVNITGLTNITLAHIHIGTTAAAGPIIVNLLPTAPAAGTFTGQLVNGTFSTIASSAPVSFDGLVDLIRNGDAYINVHTSANGGGELRGQLVPAP